MIGYIFYLFTNIVWHSLGWLGLVGFDKQKPLQKGVKQVEQLDWVMAPQP